MALIPRSTYEMYLRPTLADRQGWVLFCSTPRGFNFWEEMVNTRGQSEQFPEWESWTFPSTSSPYFKDDVEELQRTMTRETYLQEIEASFQSYSGKVYNFDYLKQVDASVKYDPSLPVYGSIDWGYRRSAFGVFQTKINKSGLPTIYQIDEICCENTKTSELANKINSLPYTFVRLWGDPAGAGTNLQSGISDIEVFKRHSLKVDVRRDKISRNIVSGVAHVRRFFEDAQGNCSFFINPKCENSIQSYENYRYPEIKADQRVREEPLKDGRWDHSCDMLRYFLTGYYPIRNQRAGTTAW
tara:strand:- start:981 stop:1877 length:897 start_codon:yes stop_codon:yes gene_type:complete